MKILFCQKLTNSLHQPTKKQIPGDMMDTQQQQYQIQGQTNVQTNQRAPGMMNNPMNNPMNRPMLNKPMGGYVMNNGGGAGGPGTGPNMNNYMAAQQRGFMGQQGKKNRV